VRHGCCAQAAKGAGPIGGAKSVKPKPPRPEDAIKLAPDLESLGPFAAHPFDAQAELRIRSKLDGGTPTADETFGLFAKFPEGNPLYSDHSQANYLFDSNDKVHGAYVKLHTRHSRLSGSVNVYSASGKVTINTKAGFKAHVAGLVRDWTKPR
jgi:hypothetical protein